MTFMNIFAIALFFIAAPLVLGGLQLLVLGGSVYYIFAGLAVGCSAYFCGIKGIWRL